MNLIEWPTTLHLTWGGDERLCGIRVYHDFEWTDVFHHKRAEFRHGKCLAELVNQSRPKDKIAALLLTRIPEITVRTVTTDQYYITIVNIDKYLKIGSGNAAKTFFANVMPTDVITAVDKLLELSDEAKQDFLAKNLNIDLLRIWIDADPTRANILARILRDSHIDPRALVDGHEQEIAEIIPNIMGESFWLAIEKAGVELPAALAHRRLWATRKTCLEEFQTHLKKADWQEKDWQLFFEQNIWIFGYSLRYQFLHKMADNPSLSGVNIFGKGSQESDYLLATAAIAQFTVLVEIKKPNTDLVTDIQYRNKTYKLGPDLVGGITQLQQQCRQLDISASSSPENRDLLESQGIFTHEPKGILVIGNTNTLKDNRAKRNTFESFRRNIHNPEIITFDELLSRAEQSVQSYTEATNS